MERWAVHRVIKVDPGVPNHLVQVTLRDQMTGAESSRDLDWNQLHAPELPYSMKVGETGTIKVELARLQDQDGRPVYRCVVEASDQWVRHVSMDPRLVGSQPANSKAMKALVSFLQDAAQRVPLRDVWPQI